MQALTGFHLNAWVHTTDMKKKVDSFSLPINADVSCGELSFPCELDESVRRSVMKVPVANRFHPQPGRIEGAEVAYDELSSGEKKGSEAPEDRTKYPVGEIIEKSG